MTASLMVRPVWTNCKVCPVLTSILYNIQAIPEKRRGNVQWTSLSGDCHSSIYYLYQPILELDEDSFFGADVNTDLGSNEMSISIHDINTFCTEPLNVVIKQL